MTHILIVFLSLSMIYMNVKVLYKIPVSDYSFEHYLFIFITAVFAVTAVYFSFFICQKLRKRNRERK